MSLGEGTELDGRQEGKEKGTRKEMKNKKTGDEEMDDKV